MAILAQLQRYMTYVSSPMWPRLGLFRSMAYKRPLCKDDCHDESGEIARGIAAYGHRCRAWLRMREQ